MSDLSQLCTTVIVFIKLFNNLRVWHNVVLIKIFSNSENNFELLVLKCSHQHSTCNTLETVTQNGIRWLSDWCEPLS